MSLFESVFYIDSWLFICVVILTVESELVIFFVLKGDSKKYKKTIAMKAKKNDNDRKSNQEKKQRTDFKNVARKTSSIILQVLKKHKK